MKSWSLVRNKILFISGVIGIMLSCSKKDDQPIDTKEAILGKWECIEYGNWPDGMHSTDKPGGYEEFLPDSIIAVYEYDTKAYYYLSTKYAIDDSIFYHIDYIPDGRIFKQRYRHHFYDDKLRLHMLDALPIFDTFIYKRLK